MLFPGHDGDLFGQVIICLDRDGYDRSRFFIAPLLFVSEMDDQIGVLVILEALLENSKIEQEHPCGSHCWVTFQLALCSGMSLGLKFLAKISLSAFRTPGKTLKLRRHGKPLRIVVSNLFLAHCRPVVQRREASDGLNP